MAELLSIDFGDTFERLTQIKNATRELKEENEKLKKSIEENGDASKESLEEAEKAMLKNEAAVRALGKEQRTLNKLVDDTIKQEKAQKGSIEANRAELSKLTAEYIKLAKPTKEQTDRIKTLSDTLKKQEGALGDTRRNVGNYQSAMEGALKNVKIFGVNVGDTVNALKQKKTQLQATANSFGPVNFSMKGAVNGLKAFRVALISTGIGAIILALTTMAGLFLKSETGMELVNKAMTIFGAVVDTAIKRVEQFAKGVAFILNGEFSKGVDAISGSFKGLGEEIRNATAAASALADAQERLEDAEIAFIERRAKIRAEIQDLRDLANDESKSLADRQLALQSALVLQGEQMATEQELAQMRIDNAEAEFEISAKTDDDLRKLAEARAAAFEDERDRTKEKIKLENELNALNKQGQKEATEREKEKKRLEKEALAEAEKLKKESLSKQLQTDREYFEQQNLILKEGLATGELTQAEFNKKSGELKIQEFESQIEILETFGQDVVDVEVELANLIADGKIAAREKDFVHQQAIAERVKELNLELVEADQELQDAKVDLAQGTFDIIEQFAKEDSTLAQAIFAAQKVAALSEVIIGAQRGFAAIAANLATVPPVLGVIPNPMYPVAVALAAKEKISLGIQTGISLATIGAQAVKGFLQEGGELQRLDGGGKVVNIGGRSHAHGGTQISLDGVPVAEAEAGEKMFILKRTASEFINKYSTLNQLFGGKSWNGQSVRHAALGGNIASSFDGGFVAREAIRGVRETISLDKTTFQVSVGEINRVQKSVAKTVDVSEL